MAKAEATLEELVDVIEGGQLRLPEMQRLGFSWASFEEVQQSTFGSGPLCWQSCLASPPKLGRGPDRWAGLYPSRSDGRIGGHPRRLWM